MIFRQGEQRVGIFARVAGAFMSCGIDILRAEIVTVGDEIVWDEFWVADPDYPDEPPSERIEKVVSRVTHLLNSPDDPLPPTRRTLSVGKKRDSAALNVLPTKVDFDNETLDRFTIVSLFAYDQTGLLYRVASALSGMNLVLHFAKMDTHLDQVADVFYVTEEDGRQLDALERQEEVRAAILDVVSPNDS